MSLEIRKVLTEREELGARFMANQTETTPEAAIDSALSALLESWAQGAEADEAKQVADEYRSATPQQKAAAKAALRKER